jgi:hypothetical protein
MTTTTQEGVNQNNVALDEDGAADAFLKRWSEEDPETASETREEEEAEDEDESSDAEAEEDQEDPEDSQEDPQDEDEDAAEDTEEDEDKASDKEASDDIIVKIKEGDKVHEVSVKDLKRLYGQEAALTKKSQAVADERKAVEANGEKLAAQLQRVYDKVAARWKPYAEVDMLVASTQLDAESFAALRAEAKAAYDDFQFVTQECDSFVANAKEAQQTSLRAQAAKAVEVLSERIPGWNEKVYNDVRAFAIKTGMNAEVVNQLVDPAALELIHMAMKHASVKTVVTKKKQAQPKKVIKTTKQVTRADIKSEKADKAIQRLRKSGSVDDAADAFMARWSNE